MQKYKICQVIVLTILITFKQFIMKNDSYHKAKKKARQRRVEKRVEWLNTPLKEKIEQGSIMSQIKSIKELADEIKELTGRK